MIASFIGMVDGEFWGLFSLERSVRLVFSLDI
jgi:hypothetical protein